MNADIQNKKIRNKPAVVAGTIAGLISVLALNEVFQWGAARLSGITASLSYKIFYLRAVLPEMVEIEPALNVMIALAPVIFCLLVIEGLSLTFRFAPPGKFRYFSILTILFNLGYILVKIFYGSFLVIISPEGSSDWHLFINGLNLTGTGALVFIMITVFIFVAYSGTVTGRIKKCITI